MTDNKVVIEGEAPETDSDDDTKIGNKADRVREGGIRSRSVQGASVDGEASESDDEQTGSISSAVSAMAHQQPIPVPQHTHEEKFSSLLHKKLRERNRSLSTDIRAMCFGTVTDASRTLQATDGQLLRSQVALQTAIGSLRNLNQHALQLSHALTSIHHDNFFHNVALTEPRS